jgi:hypothetical protein
MAVINDLTRRSVEKKAPDSLLSAGNISQSKILNIAI